MQVCITTIYGDSLLTQFGLVRFKYLVSIYHLYYHTLYHAVRFHFLYYNKIGGCVLADGSHTLEILDVLGDCDNEWTLVDMQYINPQCYHFILLDNTWWDVCY